jgi:hypothetical protein
MRNEPYVEHINFSFKNLDLAVRFMNAALPEFKERGGGVRNGKRWVHLGTESSYIAMNEGEPVERTPFQYEGYNHIGIVVLDANVVAKRLLEAGFKRGYPTSKDTFRTREYFLDDEGNEYEFVQYLSEKEGERNLYED